MTYNEVNNLVLSRLPRDERFLANVPPLDRTGHFICYFCEAYRWGHRFRALLLHLHSHAKLLEWSEDRKAFYDVCYSRLLEYGRAFIQAGSTRSATQVSLLTSLYLLSSFLFVSPLASRAHPTLQIHVRLLLTS